MFHSDWLADVARMSRTAATVNLFGLHPLRVAMPLALATGWTLASDNISDHWQAELLPSGRAGQPQITGPADAAGSP